MSRRISLAAMTGLTALALALSGCGADLPEPVADPVPTPPPPVISEAQDTKVLAAVGRVLSASETALDPALLAPRTSGPALTMRTAQLTAAAKLKAPSIVSPLPTAAQQTIIPTTQTWPRASYAISVRPDNGGSPRLLVLEQAGAHDQYKLRSWVRLFPGVTMPPFADPTLGSPAVPADATDLVVSPTDALAQYADVLNLGAKSGFAATFEPTDTYRTEVSADVQRQTAALAGAKGKQTLTYTPVKDEPVRAVRSSDGGAMAVGVMTAVRLQTGEERSGIGPATQPEKGLFTGQTRTNVLRVTFDVVVAFYIPAADAGGKVKTLGSEQVPITIATK